jgi:hypothetical protein
MGQNISWVDILHRSAMNGKAVTLRDASGVEVSGVPLG